MDNIIESFDEFKNMLNEAAKISIEVDKGYNKNAEIDSIKSFSWTPPVTRVLTVIAADGVIEDERVILELVISNGDKIVLHRYQDKSVEVWITVADGAKVKVDKRTVNSYFSTTRSFTGNMLSIYLAWLND